MNRILRYRQKTTRMSRRPIDVSEPLFTVEDAAAYLKVVERTVINEIRRGNLRGCKVGRLWRIKKSDLGAYLRARYTAKIKTR